MLSYHTKSNGTGTVSVTQHLTGIWISLTSISKIYMYYLFMFAGSSVKAPERKDSGFCDSFDETRSGSLSDSQMDPNTPPVVPPRPRHTFLNSVSSPISCRPLPPLPSAALWKSQRQDVGCRYLAFPHLGHHVRLTLDLHHVYDVIIVAQFVWTVQVWLFVLSTGLLLSFVSRMWSS